MIHYMGVLYQVGQTSGVFSRGHLKQKYLVNCGFIWLLLNSAKVYYNSEYRIACTTVVACTCIWKNSSFLLCEQVQVYFINGRSLQSAVCKNTEAVMIC